MRFYIYISHIHICKYIHIHNEPALPACNWSKARLVPPLGWTNGYAQAKANPCASSTIAITTSSSSSNNVLLLLLWDRTETVTVDSCETRKMQKSAARRIGISWCRRRDNQTCIIRLHIKSYEQRDIDLLCSACSCQRAIKSRAGNSDNSAWSHRFDTHFYVS